MKNKNLDEITYLINGCAIKVHNQLGNGFTHMVFISKEFVNATHFRKLYTKDV
ncbi:hypothetical protein [Mangrovivirga cuniculi]|uniref:hypothetical protein n=1 Tax=Mangrovivirga cuniculi TaxID=2715131 RepID=UPI002939468F|nr:hypothetical protein [Mangrovivirga cuniculi]